MVISSEPKKRKNQCMHLQMLTKESLIIYLNLWGKKEYVARKFPVPIFWIYKTEIQEKKRKWKSIVVDI